MITDSEFERVLQTQTSSRARATQMQHAARYHIVSFSNLNPIYARKMSEKLEEILQRFKDDWDALERELRRFIDELKRGDQNDFPGLDPNVQVPFVRLVLEECSKGRELNQTQRSIALSAPPWRWLSASGRKSVRLAFGRTRRCANCLLERSCEISIEPVFVHRVASAIWRNALSPWQKRITKTSRDYERDANG